MKMEMGLLLKYWKAELRLNGLVRCPMFKVNYGCMIVSIYLVLELSRFTDMVKGRYERSNIVFI